MTVAASTPQKEPKITLRHLDRKAYVYVRQSSSKQLHHHKEGRENQYDLKERALGLGWREEDIQIIDSDLGLSGQTSHSREGFKELVSEVSLGHAGIIFCFEASRLARNNADWYALLDLCALRGTLIADTNGVYDAGGYNDRMLLGLRGMMSEAELHLLRERMDAGRLRQVEQGTYRQLLPTGLVRLPSGRVAKDSDVHVQRTIELVFERFEQLGSVQKVLRSFREDGVLLPRRQTGGDRSGELLWKESSSTAIREILRNPAYGGAFAYGRKGPDPDADPPVTSANHEKSMQQWFSLHHDVYPAYVSWERFMAINKRLDQNGYNFSRQLSGAPRQGRALLAGLVYCGKCGHRMRVHYRNSEGGLRYACDSAKTTHQASGCFHLNGECIDQAVVEAFFEAVRPSEIALLDEVLEGHQEDHRRLLEYHRDAVKSASYEARLAEKRYREVDPENRLVASGLESDWESALRNLAAAKEELERLERERPEPALDPELREQLADLCNRLPELWDSGRLCTEHKKELLRSLISRIILCRPQLDTIEVRIVWISGAVSELTVHPKVRIAKDLSNYEQMVEKILAMAREGYRDKVIACTLTEEGFRSAQFTDEVPVEFVAKLRREHGQPSLTHQFRNEDKIGGQWTVGGLSRKFGVDRNWIYNRIKRGKIPAEYNQNTGFYLIDDDPQLIAYLENQLSISKGKRCI